MKDKQTPNDTALRKEAELIHSWILRRLAIPREIAESKDCNYSSAKHDADLWLRLTDKALREEG